MLIAGLEQLGCGNTRGEGQNLCVMSDSFNSRGFAEELQESGDLPEVEVIQASQAVKGLSLPHVPEMRGPWCSRVLMPCLTVVLLFAALVPVCADCCGAGIPWRQRRGQRNDRARVRYRSRRHVQVPHGFLRRGGNFIADGRRYYRWCKIYLTSIFCC